MFGAGVLPLADAGFDLVEERQPGFLFERSVLVTGEVPRTTGYEPGFPVQQAWSNGDWEPDPLVLETMRRVLEFERRLVIER